MDQWVFSSRKCLAYLELSWVKLLGQCEEWLWMFLRYRNILHCIVLTVKMGEVKPNVMKIILGIVRN